jgi:23S rRNA (cytosine1962-C5)-methyltransferase
VEYCIPARFEDWGPWTLRRGFIEADLTTAYRVVHGIADGWATGGVERFGDWLLWQTDEADSGTPRDCVESLRQMAAVLGCRGIYGQVLRRRLQAHGQEDLSPQYLWGANAPNSWSVRENGLDFEVSFTAGYSVGLFLDQRDNRRRLLTNFAGRGFTLVGGGLKDRTVLNTFAYTCGFSACAARAGARTTSIDLSRRFLAWGHRNFELNGLPTEQHEFLHGDVFEWCRRLARGGREYDVVIADPPTFSRSRTGGVFRAEHDFRHLVRALVPLVKRGGVLFVSTNATALGPDRFLEEVQQGVLETRRRLTQVRFAPPPPDFPVEPRQPLISKSYWLRLD